MVKWTRLSICNVSYQLILSTFFIETKLRKIYWYSTAATDEAAYIIGGYQGSNYSPTISEFKNDQWRKLGNLTQGRILHGSISVGQKTMVVGGETSSR